uniref:Uncharacterized protein n=1 Tax=Leersia perrieri TaxID=77586 RepID=A0A0D9V6S1_9ORYZ
MGNIVASCFRKLERKSKFSNYPYFFTHQPCGLGRARFISFQDMVMTLLVRPEFRVIVINGIGGSGKTWAAKAAFKHARSICHFDEFTWVSLSKGFSLERCIEKIAICLSIDTGEDISIESIRVKIKEKLIGRKFLLVLDNACFIEENVLEKLGIPHPQQYNLGSKVIVTTRTTRTDRVMKPDISITPIPLTHEEAHDLLCNKIGKDINSSRTLDLVRHCYGLPLSVILLAGTLCDLPRQQTYDDVINNASVSLGVFQISEFHTMRRLVKFGYSQLPNDATKDCLLYCLLFREDQEIPIKYLIPFWIMDGLLSEANEFQEANRVGKEILNVLVKHGMLHLEDNDCVRMHDIVRETISIFGSGYTEHPDYYYVYCNTSDVDMFCNRISLISRKRELFGSPKLFGISTLLLRENCHIDVISEDFFLYMGMLRVLDLSFTRIVALPSSISCLTSIRMLLMVECKHLEEIQHIDALSMLEVLDASGCGSLKWVEPGSFNHMVSLKILNFSGTSIYYLPSLAANMDLREVLLQDCPHLISLLSTKPSAGISDIAFIRYPYCVSKTGVVRNLQLGVTKGVIDWMAMMWVPCGLTFVLSDGFSGGKVSMDFNEDNRTYIYASDTRFFQSLDKGSPLWLNCFNKFYIVIFPLKDDQFMNNDPRVMRTQLFQDSYLKKKHFADGIDTDRFLEIDCVSNFRCIEGILCHAELVSLKRVAGTDLVVKSMAAARELWIENCEQLENLFLVEEVQVLCATSKLQNLWISNMQSLTSFCKAVKDTTSLNCLMHLLLDSCPKLTLLFPSSLRLPNLQTLHIRFCDSLKRVFDKLMLGEDVLPSLRSLQLWELPELTYVCGGILPSLKDLKVRGCKGLTKIPVGVNEDSPFFTTIIGDTPWWSNLIWDDETIKRWILFRNWGPLLPHLATEG